MISVGTIAEQKQQLAEVAGQLFGKPFKPEAVVRETLVAKFPGAPNTDALKATAAAPVNLNAPEAAILAPGSHLEAQ